MNTATDSLETNTPKTGGGLAVGQSSSDLVGFWGVTPVDQPASLTAQLTTITPADAEGTPDYAIAAVTNTSPYGLASAQEFITLLYVVKNLQVRMAELEARLEEAGIIAAN
jgi:hypothetical protein